MPRIQSLFFGSVYGVNTPLAKKPTLTPANLPLTMNHPAPAFLAALVRQFALAVAASLTVAALWLVSQL
jgi:hypothetical protein